MSGLSIQSPASSSRVKDEYSAGGSSTSTSTADMIGIDRRRTTSGGGGIPPPESAGISTNPILSPGPRPGSGSISHTNQNYPLPGAGQSQTVQHHPLVSGGVSVGSQYGSQRSGHAAAAAAAAGAGRMTMSNSSSRTNSLLIGSVGPTSPIQTGSQAGNQNALIGNSASAAATSVPRDDFFSGIHQ